MKPRLGDAREDGVLHLGVDVISGGPAPRLGGGASFLFQPDPPLRRAPSVLRNDGPPIPLDPVGGGPGGDGGGGSGDDGDGGGDGVGSADGTAF